MEKKGKKVLRSHTPDAELRNHLVADWRWVEHLHHCGGPALSQGAWWWTACHFFHSLWWSVHGKGADKELWRSQVTFFLSSQPSEHFQVTLKHSGTVHQWNRVAAVLRMGPGRWWLGTPWWNSSASSAQKTTQNHEGTTPALRSSIFAYDCSWGLCRKIRILFDCWVFCFTKRSWWLSASSACICLFLLKQ